MAYIINCTDQVKHKTEKTKIIVKGAETYLGMKDIPWEDKRVLFRIVRKPQTL